MQMRPSSLEQKQTFELSTTEYDNTESITQISMNTKMHTQNAEAVVTVV